MYVKTGDQSDLSAVLDAGWKCFSRRDLLRVLGRGEVEGVSSDIFRGFLLRLRQIEEVSQSWQFLPVKDGWGNNPGRWAGFFSELQSRLEGGKWGYVPFPGDFMGFHWHWRGNVYLQLEEKKLCFKLMVRDPAEQVAKWHDWHARLMAESSTSSLRLKRPARRSSGTFMTVALLDGEYRVAKPDGLIDLDATVTLLRNAERLVDAACRTA